MPFTGDASIQSRLKMNFYLLKKIKKDILPFRLKIMDLMNKLLLFFSKKGDSLIIKKDRIKMLGQWSITMSNLGI